MLFNSYPFLFIYLPFVLVGFFLTVRKFGSRSAILFLVFASLVFYSIWDINNLPILLTSILFNFFVGKKIEASGAGKRWLAVGVCVDLILLCFFKYSAFFVISLNQFFHTKFYVPEITLPLGISFFTFTQIAYLVDTWRGDARTSIKDGLPAYALFVTIFPHLIAGPILHHKKIIPQFHDRNTFVFSHPNMMQGLALLILGLAKKVLIADNLIQWVHPVFSNAAQVSFIEAWIGVICYTLQIYFDFSGYSDMAVGLARMLNIDIPFNFNSPYKATSIIDFWKRWHISLSQFLRDYLYIPLGGNRLGETRRYANLFITMLLGGLWHGAGFTFIFWGAWHGLSLAVNHLWRKIAFPLPRAVGWALTLLVVMLAWVFFRAQSLHDALEIFKSMAGLKERVLPVEYATKLPWLSMLGFAFKGDYLEHVDGVKKALLAIMLLLPSVAFLPNSQEIVKKVKPNLTWALGLACLGILTLMNMNKVSEFLYFQF